MKKKWVLIIAVVLLLSANISAFAAVGSGSGSFNAWQFLDEDRGSFTPSYVYVTRHSNRHEAARARVKTNSQNATHQAPGPAQWAVAETAGSLFVLEHEHFLNY
ncbi:MAG: hypothetical protein FWE14_01365 [Lachnospiraceae bacterium]|nr:hypothetical protein [Lachnospiraceae bacterium]